MSFSGQLPTRRLGPGGPQVPILGLGSWNTWDRMDFDDAVALIRRAADVGAAFFDVAHYNMGPHAEQSRTDLIFGRAVHEAGLARGDFQICGKLWLWEYPRTGFARQLDTSLARIGLDNVEAVVVGDYTAPIDVEAIVTDVAEQISAGRFAIWGVNNWQAGDLQEALDFAHAQGLTPPSFAQLKYSLSRRTVAEGAHYGRLFAEGTLALQASDIFEGGILAGKAFPERKIGADVGGVRELIRRSYPELERIADRFGASPTQLGLAFTLANPATANVLFGVSRMAQLEDNLGAVELAAAHGEAIRAAVEPLWVDRGRVNVDGS